jgi:hypothetical protein
MDRDLARRNDLTIGSTISLTLFDGQHIYYSNDDSVTNIRYGTWEPGGYIMGMTEAKPLEFEIVGIYIAQRPRLYDPNALDLHRIPLNTLFIPDNSITWLDGPSGDYRNQVFLSREYSIRGSNRVEPHVIPLLNTVIIKNGRSEEFRQTIDALIPGYGNFFRIFDQGYSIVRASLDNLMRGGILVFALCLAGWLVSAIVFCMFFIMRKKGDAGLLYAMGFSRKSRFRWVFLQCLLIIIVAQLIAFITSSMLQEQILDIAFDIVTEETSETLIVDFTDAIIAEEGSALDFKLSHSHWVVPLSVGSASVVLLLFTYLISMSIAKKGLHALRRSH